MPTFKNTDTLDTLTTEQLTHLSEVDSSWVEDYLRQETKFDSEQVRLLLALGRVEAKKRIDA